MYIKFKKFFISKGKGEIVIGREEPNIKRLREYIAENGNIIKNYKELCSILEMSKKTNTERKKKQMQWLECYFEYRIVGHRIIIDEIFDTPIKVVSHERSTYGADIENQLINLIIETGKTDEDGNKFLYLNMKTLCEELGFFNLDFNKFKYNKQYLKERAEKLFEYYRVQTIEKEPPLKDTETLIDYFYQKIYLQNIQTVKRNLKKLQSDKVIRYETVYEYHPVEMPKVKWYIESSGATRDEFAVIESCRLELMVDMKEEINNLRRKKGKPIYKKFNMSHIFIYGKSEEYFTRLNEMYSKRLSKCFGYYPKYIVPAYKISLHPMVVEKLSENACYLKEAMSKDIGESIININNKVLKSTYRGFLKSFNIILDSDETNLECLDYKTGERFVKKITEVDMDKFINVSDVLRFRILQRMILLVTCDIAESKEFGDADKKSWFVDVLYDINKPLLNYIGFS